MQILTQFSFVLDDGTAVYKIKVLNKQTISNPPIGSYVLVYGFTKETNGALLFGATQVILVNEPNAEAIWMLEVLDSTIQQASRS